jgi:hypothetical protein
MNELTKQEKVALICANASRRYEDYLTVKSMPGKTLRQIEQETGINASFAHKCRKIAKKHSL